MPSVGAVYDRPFWLNHGKCAVTDRAYSSSIQHHGDQHRLFRWTDVHDASPKRVRPTRTVPIPASIAALTARSFGIIPPLTKLAERSSAGSLERSISLPSTF